MIRSLRDVLAFLLLGAILPCIFFTVTGTPEPLVMLVLAWVIYTVTEPKR